MDTARRRSWMRARMGLLGALLLVFAGTLVRRAYELQVERAPVLKEMAEEQYLRDVHLSPKRGTILDRNGAELAVSVDTDSVWANPRAMRAAGQDPIAAAKQLAALTGADEARITARLKSDRFFVWIKRRVTPQQAKAVKALNLEGVHFEREARRYYPNRELASHLLGFANIDGQGIEGLELAFDEQLRGPQRSVPAIRDRRGRVVFSEQLLDDRAARGDDLVLTIDQTIQHVAERELELAVRTFEAKSASVVVLDPNSGEVLAMANYPTFDPNHPGQSPAGARRNRALTDRYEPGSTVKPFTVAGALTAGTVRTDQLIDCEGGAMQVAEYTINDSHVFDELTPAQILAFSSNIGTAKIGSTMGRQGLFRTFRNFGFGEKTLVPLPGETAGNLRHYRKWYEMDAATISFGQGMSATTMQMAVAMGAIANGGKLMAPILVKQVRDAEGHVVQEALPKVRRRVVPTRVARLVSDMLTAVTGPEGTGAEAALDGYLAAGKTGTAQKADYIAGGYADDRWLASFVGFAPAQNPKLVIAVAVDEPMIAHYGGVVAGPVFRRVAEASLQHLGVPAQTGGEALARAVDAQRAAAKLRASFEKNREVEAPVLVTGPVREGDALVPDLLGQTARAAVVALHQAELTPRIEGTGLVVGMSPEPGAHVPRGETVVLSLEAPTYDTPDPIVEEGVINDALAQNGLSEAGKPSGAM